MIGELTPTPILEANEVSLAEMGSRVSTLRIASRTQFSEEHRLNPFLAGKSLGEGSARLTSTDELADTPLASLTETATGQKLESDEVAPGLVDEQSVLSGAMENMKGLMHRSRKRARKFAAGIGVAAGFVGGPALVYETAFGKPAQAPTPSAASEAGKAPQQGEEGYVLNELDCRLLVRKGPKGSKMELNKGRTRVILEVRENPLPKECAIYGTLRISTAGQAHVWGGAAGWGSLNPWAVKENANSVRKFRASEPFYEEYHNKFPCKPGPGIMSTRQKILHEWTAKPGYGENFVKKYIFIKRGAPKSQSC